MSSNGRRERYAVEGDEENPDNEFDPSEIPDGVGEQGSGGGGGGRVGGGTDTSVADGSKTTNSVGIDFDPTVPRRREAIESGLPFIYQRADVTSDRSQLSIYAVDETERAMRRLEFELDGHFGSDDVQSLDVREAVLVVGLKNVDQVVGVLESWGYGER